MKQRKSKLKNEGERVPERYNEKQREWMNRLWRVCVCVWGGGYKAVCLS
jgi:hypothetical protein